jgi:hypothetical protein
LKNDASALEKKFGTPYYSGVNDANRKRNRRNGQYTFEGDFDRLCTCGHTLGVHTAEAPHECINGDVDLEGATGEQCDCAKFKPSKKGK